MQTKRTGKRKRVRRGRERVRGVTAKREREEAMNGRRTRNPRRIPRNARRILMRRQTLTVDRKRCTNISSVMAAKWTPCSGPAGGVQIVLTMISVTRATLRSGAGTRAYMTRRMFSNEGAGARRMLIKALP